MSRWVMASYFLVKAFWSAFVVLQGSKFVWESHVRYQGQPGQVQFWSGGLWGLEGWYHSGPWKYLVPSAFCCTRRPDRALFLVSTTYFGICCCLLVLTGMCWLLFFLFFVGCILASTVFEILICLCRESTDYFNSLPFQKKKTILTV